MAADSELPRQNVAGHVRLSALLLQQMAPLYHVIANTNDIICFWDVCGGLVKHVLDSKLKGVVQIHSTHLPVSFEGEI